MLLRGIYTAASAMLVDQARMDVTSNNLANVNTAGFKQDQVVVESFRQMWLHASKAMVLPFNADPSIRRCPGNRG